MDLSVIIKHMFVMQSNDEQSDFSMTSWRPWPLVH